MDNAARRGVGERKVALACDPEIEACMRSRNMRPPTGSGSHLRPVPKTTRHGRLLSHSKLILNTRLK